MVILKECLRKVLAPSNSRFLFNVLFKKKKNPMFIPFIARGYINNMPCATHLEFLETIYHTYCHNF